jgi:hypothetical protein
MKMRLLLALNGTKCALQGVPNLKLRPRPGRQGLAGEQRDNGLLVLDDTASTGKGNWLTPWTVPVALISKQQPGLSSWRISKGACCRMTLLRE